MLFGFEKINKTFHNKNIKLFFDLLIQPISNGIIKARVTFDDIVHKQQ